MPVALSGSTSLIQTGGTPGSEAATLLVVPGVAGASFTGAGAMSMVLRMPLPESLSVSVPPVVSGRYQ